MKGIFQKRAGRTAAFILICFFVSLIPIFYVSFFNHPSADDYGYSDLVRSALLGGGGFPGAMRAACSEVVDTYFTWQGTFSAVFLFSLQPAVFSPHLYFLSTFLMIGALTGCTVFFYETVLVRWLGCSKSNWIIVSFLTLFATIQFIPDRSEAFYWYNGSVYYTFFYSLALLLAALLIRILLAQSMRGKIILTVLSCLLSVVIGGGNYTTVFVTTLLYALAAVLVLRRKAIGRWCFLIPLPFLAASFLISATAPGNAVRAVRLAGRSLSPVQAIGRSLLCAFGYFGQWSALPQVVLFLFLTPLLYRAAQKCRWSFRNPLAVCVLAFCFFACQMTPPLYAMGFAGAGREIDVYYDSYYLLVIFCIFYLCGWMNRNFPQNVPADTARKMIHDRFASASLACLVLFLAGCCGLGVHGMTSFDTAAAIRAKTVNRYDAEYCADLQKLETEKDVCRISELRTLPDFFKPLKLQSSPDFWVNQELERYFKIRQVVKD